MTQTKDERTAQMMSEIDTMIDRYNMEKRCGKTRNELRTEIRKSMLQNNLAFILADVANWFLLDCEASMRELGVAFDGRDKKNFSMMKSKITEARKWASMSALPLYHLENGESDNAMYDSDWWYKLIKLVDDRLGDDPRKTNIFLEFLLNMPSEVGLFNVTYEDFKRKV